jgi:hypothetical protein
MLRTALKLVNISPCAAMQVCCPPAAATIVCVAMSQALLGLRMLYGDLAASWGAMTG